MFPSFGKGDFVKQNDFFFNLNVHFGRMCCSVVCMALCGMRCSHGWRDPNCWARPGSHKLCTMENEFLYLTICQSDDAEFLWMTVIIPGERKISQLISSKMYDLTYVSLQPTAPYNFIVLQCTPLHVSATFSHRHFNITVM